MRKNTTDFLYLNSTLNNSNHKKIFLPIFVFVLWLSDYKISHILVFTDLQIVNVTD